MAVGVVTSFLLSVVDSELALTLVYGLAGVGVAAFTPSALALVAGATRPARVGRAFARYAMAHYGAIGVGPFLGGLTAESWGYRATFVLSAIGIAIALVVGLAIPLPAHVRTRRPQDGTLAHVIRTRRIWAGWIASIAGMLVQGVFFTFLPLVAHDQGLSPGAIGFIFLALGLANTLVRGPAGWLVDRTARSTPYAVAGVIVASVATALVPHVESLATVAALAAVFGAVSGIAFVAISVALSTSATPATRGVVMGGYSTSLYLGLALGSLALGPVITRAGYGVGFAVGGGAGVVGILVAAWLWSGDPRRAEPLAERSKSGRNARALADSSRCSP
jgi:predicted MFS family arabinose efflux permease